MSQIKNLHGGINYREILEAGGSPHDILDFSVSINPCRLPESVSEAVREADLTHYPDTQSWLLTRALSQAEGRSPDQIMPVSGTTEAISLIGALWGGPGRKAVIIEPTYSDYRKVSARSGAEVLGTSSLSGFGLKPDIEQIIPFIRKHMPSLVWLCNPNNPTGYYLQEGEFTALRDAVTQQGGLLVCDEAYLNFLTLPGRYDTAHEGVIQLRSMTKDFGIPGLRIGYVMAPAKNIEALKARQMSWSLSSVAQAVGRACLAETAYFRQSWKDLEGETLKLKKSFDDLGCRTMPWHTNFFMMETPRAEDFTMAMHSKNILIRCCASFGFPEHIRIGTRGAEDNRRLLEEAAVFFRS